MQGNKELTQAVHRILGNLLPRVGKKGTRISKGGGGKNRNLHLEEYESV